MFPNVNIATFIPTMFPNVNIALNGYTMFTNVNIAREHYENGDIGQQTGWAHQAQTV